MVIKRLTKLSIGSVVVLSWAVTGCSRSEADLREFESDSQRASVGLEAYFRETDRLASDEYLRLAEVAPKQVESITQAMSDPVLNQTRLERENDISALRAIMNAGACLAQTSIGCAIAKRDSIGHVIWDLRHVDSQSAYPAKGKVTDVQVALKEIAGQLDGLALTKDVSPKTARNALKVLSKPIENALTAIDSDFREIDKAQYGRIAKTTTLASSSLCGSDPTVKADDPISLWNWFYAKNSTLMDHPERQLMTSWIASIRYRCKLQEVDADRNVITALKALISTADPEQHGDYSAIDASLHGVTNAVDRLETVVQQFRQGGSQ